MRVLVHGVQGKMGQILIQTIENAEGMELAGGIDPSASEGDLMYRNLDDCKAQADVVVDFSAGEALTGLLDFVTARKLPLVLATTGLTEEDMGRIQTSSNDVAVFQSPNFSLGIHLMLQSIKEVLPAVGGTYDMKIIEIHHDEKEDAPSGTALMMASALEIPAESIISLRTGTHPGEHRVLLSGKGEVLEWTHRAYDRSIFAQGALAAAEFLMDRPPGLYGMEALLTWALEGGRQERERRISNV